MLAVETFHKVATVGIKMVTHAFDPDANDLLLFRCASQLMREAGQEFDPCLRAFPDRDVAEKNSDPSEFRCAHPEGINIKPTAQAMSIVLEATGFACPGNLAIDVEPVLFVTRQEMSHALANGIDEASLLLK